MKTKVYNQKGKLSGEINLPESVFGVRMNQNAVHQTMMSLTSRARAGTAHTKGRSEVRGGGKKPWKQKGTGRSRHGSSRSPIWVGGGVTHGPTNEKNYDRKINKKMLRKIITMALSRKLKDDEIIFLDKIVLDGAKTKFAREIVDSLGAVKGFEKLSRKTPAKTVIALATPEISIVRAFKNIPNIQIMSLSQLSLLDLINNRFLVLPKAEDCVKALEARLVSDLPEKEKPTIAIKPKTARSTPSKPKKVRIATK